MNELLINPRFQRNIVFMRDCWSVNKKNSVSLFAINNNIAENKYSVPKILPHFCFYNNLKVTS